ncbi:hypothetical protein CEP52_013802 [Fusarium oligoseptatum]|uniref:Uncharacterized protein n=1 Tax=Fusarium oligoseptatum TaxID=2604345 RepID=A0A428SRN4_9HYPO|nr:hypothetical protein CEP52_013802 [Fusarium oligoseptatum]
MAEIVRDGSATNQEGIAATGSGDLDGKPPNPLDVTTYYNLKSKESADRWHQRFEAFRRPIEGHTGRASGQIKIAVLDTGIDKSMLKEEFHENIKDIKSFLPDEQVQPSGCLERNHHGTNVVAIILNLAPWVHVYIARIGKDGDESMDPSCIAKAIRHSVEHWNVHIISMSWGFKEEHECISDAIRLAYSQDTIMFAAASNEGANVPARRTVTFPASMPEVICVNSCDGFGNRSAFNPPPRQDVFNFLTLGEAVSTSSSALKPKRLTGTSFATPTAAAIAASLVEFVTQKQIFKQHQDLKQLAKTKDGMIKLFVAMSEPVSEFMYLRPWDLIKCNGSTESCPCKSCRKTAEARLREVLEGPFPLVQGSVPFLGLPDRLPSAAFDTKDRENTSSCLPQTRVNLLVEIREWADGKDTPRVYWLKGMAGTGKSTIALTVAREYHEKGRLGGSFFFSRGHADLAASRKFVVTIASQLAHHCKELRMRIQEAVSADPDIGTKGLYYQWQRLVLEPLSLARSRRASHPLLIVVDALDECEGEDDVRLLIRCLASSVPPGGYQARILITSRPDQAINIEFADVSDQGHQCFVLQDIETTIVNQDLTEFYKHQLAKTDQQFGLQDLLSDANIESLVKQSCGLFIYAATPQDQDRTLVRELDKLYTMILQSSTLGNTDPEEALGCHQSFPWFHRVVGAIVVLFDTLSASNLCTLLGENSLRPAIDHFHSVLNIPEQPEKPIGILHPSFRDFLLDPSRCSDSRFSVNEENTHGNLLDRCLRIMESGLHFNMSQHHAITAFFRHRFLFWVEALAWSGQLADSIAAVRSLQRILGDMPGNSKNAGTTSVYRYSSLLSAFKGALGKSKPEPESMAADDLMSMIHDAARFLSMHGAIIERAPLQIYISGLLFSPTASVTRKNYAEYLPKWVLQAPLVSDNWSSHLQTIKHSTSASSVAFSPKGDMLATTVGEMVRLWDTTTGSENWLPKQHSEQVKALYFSPDGTKIATVSGHSNEGDEIRLWNARMGAEYLSLPLGKALRVNSLGFSPDGKRLAAAAVKWKNAGGKVRTWDTVTGSTVQDFHLDQSHNVTAAYTSDGKFIAIERTGSYIKLLSLEDGNARCVSEPQEGNIADMVISPDHKFLAFRTNSNRGLDNTTTSLWVGNTTTAGCRLVNKHYFKVGHETWMSNSLVFSPDGKLLAACGSPARGYLFDAVTGKKKQTFSDLSNAAGSMVFSIDGRFLAVTCSDWTTRLFDTSNGSQKQILKGHSGPVTGISFSPHRDVIATASKDRTVRLWDITQSQRQEASVPDPTSIRATTFSPDWNLMLAESSGHDKTKVQLRDARTGACLGQWDEEIETSVFSPDGTQIAMLHDDRIHILDLNTGTERMLGQVPHRLRSIYVTEVFRIPLCFSADGKLLASPWEVSPNHTRGVALWNTRKGRISKFLVIDDYPITSFSFALDGTIMIATHHGGFCVWDLESGSILCHVPTLRELYTSTPGFTALSPNSRFFAICSNGATAIHLWDMETYTAVQCLSDYSDFLCFSPDGEKLASLSRDFSVTIWDVNTGVALQEHLFHTSLRHLAFSPCGSYFKTEMGSLPVSAGTAVDRSLNLLSGDWVKEGDDEIVFLHPDFQNQIGYVDGYSIVFLHAEGVESRLVLDCEGLSL